MQTSKSKLNNGWIFLWLALTLFCVYSNGFSGVWFGGDYAGIVNNGDVHMETFNVDDLVWAASSGVGLTRVLPNVTFALNWWYSNERTAGYHFTNYLLHLLAAYFLFLTAKMLWRTPRLQGVLASQKQIRIVAFGGTLLWALHPIHVDSVTYIIQRSTVMAGMFMILGLYGFLRAKMAQNDPARLGGVLICLLGFAGAALSKENVVVFPLILLLTYGVFFVNGETARKYKMLACGLGLLWIVICLLFVSVFMADFGRNVYDNLYFTPWERLLTQARVLFYYLYLILWPLPSHFQIEHYLPLSTSLFNPLTTLIAVAGLIAILGLALKIVRRCPLLSFAALFFLIGHVAESTVLPLALISEHRNYFPSMFLGLPFAYGAVWVWNRFGKRPEVRRMTMFVAILVMVMLGFSTYMRNFVWQDEAILYEAAIERNPQILTTYARFGFYWSKFQGSEAENATIWLLERAYERKPLLARSEAMRVDFSLSQAYLKAEKYDLAIALTKDNIINYADHFDNWLTARRFLGRLYMAKGDLDMAEAYFAQLLQEFPDNPEINFDYGNILFQNGARPEALPYLEKTYAELPIDSPNWTADNADTLRYNLGLLTLAAGDYAKSENYWREIWLDSKGEKKPDAAMFLIMLAKNPDDAMIVECREYLTWLKYQIVLDKFTSICDNDNVELQLRAKLRQNLNKTFDFVQK